MENKNTFPFKSNIIIHRNSTVFTPGVGDELVFCKDEDAALAAYIKYVAEERGPEYGPIEEQFLTDMFKVGDMFKTEKPTVCNQAYIGLKKFGFFGCRTKPAEWLVEGKFFLYEIE